MKKLVIASLLLTVGLFLATTKALAFGVTLSLDGLWSWGTLYSFDGVNWNATNANPYYGTVSQSLANGVPSAPDGTEDSYGTLRVNQIFPTGGGSPIYDRTVDPYELTAFFYEFDDVYISGVPAFSRLLATGGHAALYADYAKNYNATSPLGPGPIPTGGRFDGPDPGTGDGFLTVTDGTKVLDLTPRVLLDPISGASYTFENFFSFATLSGFGSVLFDVTGGTWASLYDTNTQDFGTDIKVNFASFPPGANGWVVQGSGNAQGDIIPEPTSMLLLGIGMLGLVTLKKKKAA